MNLKKLANEINSAPTLLVIHTHGIAKAVLVKPAVYGIDRYGSFFGFASFPKGGWARHRIEGPS